MPSGFSNLVVLNQVNDLQFNVQIASGSAPSNAFTVTNAAIPASQRLQVMSAQRGTVPNGSQYTIQVSTTIAGLPIVINIAIAGTFADSNMSVTASIGTKSTPTPLTDYPQSAILTDDAQIGDTQLGYTLTLQRVSGTVHDDLVASVTPAGQATDLNYILPAWKNCDYLPLLDVGGEGRIVDTKSTPPNITGFCQAYNLNQADQKISNGPDTGGNIPNLIPVDNWATPQFDIPDNSVIFMTMMGVPITAPVVKEMIRCLDQSKGVILLYNPVATDKATFEANLPPKLILKKPGITVQQLGTPFSEISPNFAPVFEYGWKDHADHDEL